MDDRTIGELSFGLIILFKVMFIEFLLFFKVVFEYGLLLFKF